MRQEDVPSRPGGVWKAWACVETARFPFAVAGILVAGSLMLVGAEAQEEQSPTEILALSSLYLGSAQYCDVNQARIAAVKSAIIELVNPRIDDEADRARKLRVFDKVIEMSRDAYKAAQSPCSEVVEHFDKLERSLGLR